MGLSPAALLALTLVVAEGERASSGRAPAGDPRVAVMRALAGLDATDLSGRTWSIRELRGRVVLIDFWATWCAPCLAELPRLQALHAALPREDFEILGVSLDVMTRRGLVSWLNRHRIDWPQIHERGGYAGATARRFGIDRLPRTIVLARDGRVAALDVRGAALERLIRRLVAEPHPAGGGSAAP